MPRIPTSQVSNLPAGAPIPRGTSMSVMMGPGQALVAGSEKIQSTMADLEAKTKVARDKQKKIEAQAYVNGLGSEALMQWNTLRDTNIQQHGAGNSNIIDLTSGDIDDFIIDKANQAPSDYAYEQTKKDLYRLKQSFIKETIKNQRSAFKTENTRLLTEDLNTYRTQIRDNWNDWLPYWTNGLTALKGAAVWQTPEENNKAVNEFIEGASSDVLSGWYGSQVDKIGASEMIRNGDINLDLNRFLNKLDTDQRNELANDLLDQHNELLRAENARFQIQERVKKENTNKVLLDFFSTTPSTEGTKTHEDRLATIADLRRSNAVSPTVLRQMEDFVSGKESLDNEQIEAKILAGIYDGSIRSISDVIPYVGEGLSFQTLGDKYIPLLQSQQDKRFKSAANYLKNRLGIPDQGFLSLSLDPKAPERKRMTALSELQREFATNPSIDLFKKAEELVESIEHEEMVEHQNKVNKLKRQFDALTQSPEFADNRKLQEEAARLQIEIDYLEKNK